MKKKISLNAYNKLPKEIYVLFVARIINRMGGFVHPFITFFLTLNLGMSQVQAGSYMMINGIASMCGSMVGGFLGDHLGRKRIYVAAQAIAAFMFIPCGFIGNHIGVVYLLIGASFFSSMVGPINNAMVADYVDKDDRKRAYALLYYGINVGVAIGPLIGGYLFKSYINWFFWGDALTTLVGALLILLFIKESRMTREEMEEKSKHLDDNEKIEYGSVFIAFLRRPTLVAYTLLSMITSFVYAQGGFAMPLTLNALFEDQSTVYYGNLMSFNAIIVLGLTVFILKICERFRSIDSIMIANLLYGVGFGLFAFIHALPMFYVAVFIWTVGEIIGVTNGNVYVMNHTPISHRAQFSALIGILRETGYLISPVLSGAIIAGFGLSSLWIVVGVLGFVAAIGMYFLGKKDRIVKA